MTAPILAARRLARSFGRVPVLRDLDLVLAPGEVTVLLGRNGAGKSTLLRLAIGALRPSAGELRVLGLDPWRDAAALRRQVGYVPDTADAYGWMTPVDLFGFLAPHYPTWDGARCAELAELLALPMRTRLDRQSRGQATKTMLVAALSFAAPLLLLDEPFAGLDPLVRDELLQGVVAALRAHAVTVLCATHDLDVAARLADRVAVLAGGRIRSHQDVDAVLGGKTSAIAAIKRTLAHTTEKETAPCAP